MWHHYETPGIPAGADLSHGILKAGWLRIQAHTFLLRFSPEAFLRKPSRSLAAGSSQQAKRKLFEDSREECAEESYTNATAARDKHTAILQIQEPPQSHLASVVKIHKGLHLSSWPFSNHHRPQLYTSGLYPALWARAAAGACRERSPVSGWVSAGLSGGLVKLGSDCINRGLGRDGATEVLPGFLRDVLSQRRVLPRPRRGWCCLGFNRLIRLTKAKAAFTQQVQTEAVLFYMEHSAGKTRQVFIITHICWGTSIWDILIRFYLIMLL